MKLDVNVNMKMGVNLLVKLNMKNVKVRLAGLEPARPKAQPPQDCVSANSTITAQSKMD